MKPFTLNDFLQALIAMVALGFMQLTWADQPLALPFNSTTWVNIQKTIEQPTAVVFTTTDCTHCPKLIQTLRKKSQNPTHTFKLWVVVMDADEHPELLTQAYYQHTDRLYRFDGKKDALMYSVNPQWPGVTPYTALLSRLKKGERFVMGDVKDLELAAWLSNASRQRP